MLRKCGRHSRKTRGSRKILSEWFSRNFLKENAGKCHLILSTDEPFSVTDNEVSKNSNDKNCKELKVL